MEHLVVACRLPDSPWRPGVSVQLRHMQLGEQLLKKGVTGVLTPKSQAVSVPQG